MGNISVDKAEKKMYTTDEESAAAAAAAPLEDDEIEGLNEKLLKLIVTHSVLTSAKAASCCSVKSLSITNSDTDVDGPVETGIPRHPTVHRYKYDYAFIHRGSPMTAKHPSNWLPPIGVFWDIENCQVPKGRSAAAVAQVVRDTFFHGYREAEFIVVCDVQKENKQVVQELNDAQVNLIHVAATYKNAADEKLKQSIRRFADIHGSPACIILISSDINFAADLSDIRHRKKIHVILLHNENSSEALILCANEHFNFTELMESLPIRTSSKVSEFCDLLVSNLPQDKDYISIKRRLKRLSDNCGGRVICITPNVATIRFSSQDSADRAQKRMDGEDVFDRKIVVKSLKEKENRTGKPQESYLTVDLASETALSSPIQMYSAGASVAGARSLPGTPHYHSSSPVTGTFSGWNGVHCATSNAPPGMMPPPPMFVGRPYSSNGDVIYNRPYDLPRVPSPAIWQVATNQQFPRWDEQQQQQQQYKIEKGKSFGKRNQGPQTRESGVANGGGRTPDGMRRIRVAHGPMNHPQEWILPRPTFGPVPLPSGYNGSGFGQPNTFKRRSPSPMYTTQSIDQQRNGHQMQIRNARTPSPYQNSTVQVLNPPTNRTSPYQQNEPENQEVENFFNPINSQGGPVRDNGTLSPIELLVTNLDQSMEPKEIKRVLSLIFMENVMVLNVSVFMQSDGNFAASVKVPSLPDAQYAISQLHRRKVGYKRIIISYAQTGGPNPQLIRSQIVMLLQEVPGHKLPLFKFREMYESRFMISISMSEMSKMRDVCVISEEPDGRMVSLNPDHRNTPSPCLSNMSQDGTHLELPYCTIHTQKPWPEKGWAEQEMASLPNVKISLKILGAHVQRLLATHNGSLPLPSLPHCYEAEFKQRLEDDENGVPLEHLVSCLPSVDLKQGIGSVKYIIWVGNKTPEVSHEENKCVSPPLANHLTLFSRELVDLLKTAPHCQVLFNRFIPAYHHHFGRQCRVADYGFTKLIDLLEALTHTVQVMGEGNKRVVTLSHRAQVRRFTSDLLRVLKAQASKQIALSEFPTVYARVIDKPWNVVDYGVCDIDDILGEVSENTVVVRSFNEDDRMIAIPKREQTPEEVERTKQFAAEVVELLGHAPQCSMLFNKFVPSYHHHFGHQCRLSDYGFTKLIELFEAIPDVLKIEEVNGGERRLSLTEEVGIRVLGEQISKLVTRCRGGLSLSNVGQAFLRQFGYVLRPESFQCNSISSLMEKLSNTVKVIQMSGGPVVILVDKSHLQQLGLQCRRILMDHSQQRLPVKQFQSLYNSYYGSPCDIDEIQQDLSDVVTFSTVDDEQIIELTPLQRFASELYRVMMHYGGKMHVSQFATAYSNIVGSACQAGQYGYPSVEALLKALPCTVILQDTRHKKKQLMFLNKKLAAVGIQLPSMLASPYRNRDSSNDSESSTKSSRTSTTDTSLTQEERDKWRDQIASSQNAWPRKPPENPWPKNDDSHWLVNPTTIDEAAHKWPSEFSREALLRSVTCPLQQIEQPSSQRPPKSDTPPANEANNEKDASSSVWETPPRCYFPPDAYPQVDMPPLTLPPWFNAVKEQAVADLLSPAKCLISATANPLRPRTSPYFSSKRNLVIAPHPSELPLPSMITRIMSFSKTPKRGTTVVRDTQEPESPKTHHVPIESTKLANSLEDSSLTDSENFSNSESEVVDRVSSTPSKPIFAGKRRLAAQFNQPIDP